MSTTTGLNILAMLESMAEQGVCVDLDSPTTRRQGKRGLDFTKAEYFLEYLVDHQLGTTAGSKVSHSLAPSPTQTPKLKLKPIFSPSQLYRALQAPPKNEDFVFDFNKTTVPVANRQNFPALINTGVAFTCGMTFLHLHPRATELFAVTSGSLYSEMVPEGGVTDANGTERMIKNTLQAGQMTIYPAGSFHTQVNPNCEAAGFAAAFNADDYGFTVVANQTLALDDEIVAASFGKTVSGEDVDSIRDSLPGGVLIMVEDCLKKCGMKKRAL
ncbi:spherulin [Penicillium chermesinum]|uniref:Spherulin n=1 Tax=Penicillium chermesinum TaxID=63820 RepID=A0A9W9TRT0_9EURO|nr:spherulin [Penicillium chermesinum]KAJ5238807.1 spherulin [Penicillium chermesinum]